MATISGSVEITTASSESTGVPGVAWTVDTVPLVLGVLYGITAIAAVEPTAAPTGRVPEAQWSGTDTQGQPVTIRLWRDVPYADTLAARIGPGLAEQG